MVSLWIWDVLPVKGIVATRWSLWIKNYLNMGFVAVKFSRCIKFVLKFNFSANSCRCHFLTVLSLIAL